MQNNSENRFQQQKKKIYTALIFYTVDEAKAVLLRSTRVPDLGESAESSEIERQFKPREHVPLNRELGEGWKERFAKWKKEHPDQRKYAERQEHHVSNLLRKRMKQLKESKTGNNYYYDRIYRFQYVSRKQFNFLSRQYIVYFSPSDYITYTTIQINTTFNQQNHFIFPSTYRCLQAT